MLRVGFLRAYVVALVMSALVVSIQHAAPGAAFGPPRQDPPPVMAEAIGQANLRSGPGVEYAPLGEIVAGTAYPVLTRHTLVPWVQIDVPDVGPAWVYRDLLAISGSLAQVPGTSEFAPLETPASPSPPPGATATPTAAATGSPVASPPGLPAQPSATPAAEQPSSAPTFQGPTVTTIGEANIRFGPDLQYPVIVKVPAGQTFRVLERHTLVPWLRIALDESPTGNGWIYREIVEISGDLSGVPATNAREFGYPTLTPTPQALIVDVAPWDGAPQPQGELVTTLGAQIYEYLLGQGFAPYSERTASVFVMDLATGDRFTINDDVAFSGMSLTKIPILTAYFQQHPHPPTASEALLIANTMMCSENITTNEMLAQIGSDGTALSGAQRVTGFMQSLGLNHTFIMRPFITVPGEEPPSAGTLETTADQVSTRPDAYNQVTTGDLGWLLASLYQCAEDGTGLLVERHPDAFDAQTCRRILYAMDANEIGVFLEAGTPDTARVIHKHGWIGDTHGDAGIVVGPQGAYVFVIALYNEDWLEFDQSAPVIGEVARMTWNAFNPQYLLDALQPGIVPAECDPENDPVLGLLQSATLPMPGP